MRLVYIHLEKACTRSMQGLIHTLANTLPMLLEPAIEAICTSYVRHGPPKILMLGVELKLPRSALIRI